MSKKAGRTKVVINGKDVSSYVSSVDFKMKAGCIHMAVIEFASPDIDKDPVTGEVIVTIDTEREIWSSTI